MSTVSPELFSLHQNRNKVHISIKGMKLWTVVCGLPNVHQDILNQPFKIRVFL